MDKRAEIGAAIRRCNRLIRSGFSSWACGTCYAGVRRTALLHAQARRWRLRGVGISTFGAAL